MHTTSDIFLENMTLLITFMFVALKLKEYLLTKLEHPSRFIVLVPVALSLLSLFVMHHPFQHEGLQLDLRGVPIFFITYLCGWRLGAISVILPAVYRLYIGGPTTFEGITNGILLPFLIGALAHRKEAFNFPHTLVDIRHMLSAFFYGQIFRTASVLLTSEAEVRMLILLSAFETAALLSIGLMLNDSNRKLLTMKELEFLSRRDSMTNLYNLGYFRKKVDQLIARDKPYVIAMFDVDFFKQFNDANGHLAGDAALQKIGEILKDSVRAEDVFARYGGEEFIICFSETPTKESAAAIAEQFRARVEKEPFEGEHTQPKGKLTVSIGLSSVIRGAALNEAIAEADKALYEAKRHGRNCVAV